MDTFDAETLYYISSVIGVCFISFVILILKKIANKTKNTVDDKIVEKLEILNKENNKKIKRK